LLIACPCVRFAIETPWVLIVSFFAHPLRGRSVFSGDRDFPQ
jgi:hypothetical protein